MTREEEIEQQALLDEDGYVEHNYYAFKRGVEWADKNPDAKRIYTKKQLMDMGFSFTTNGDIVTPDQLNEDLKKYLKYQKQKFIEKACEWLDINFPNIDNIGFWYKEGFTKQFKKAMEE